ncbi:helix-turn-helix domain-containing protein [Nocardioides currus]|uniref:Transcriptional regulator n=1 Tax=Nocardioides currus TaxID=2133958 RepID=A0A2R7YZU0_9ACTN|nr:helix-turn-helix domain-containing protein [Nocardioides currus]PUA81409.1 transcriptional regulator [Nocardioides currus]
MTPRVVRAATQASPLDQRTVVDLDDEVVEVLRGHLAVVAERAVSSIIEEVPSYAGALSGPMGATIRNAVQLALGGFLTLAGRGSERPPMAPALEGAYQLGRGEARSGRTMEALLAAYRIGARVSWRDLSRTAVEAGIDAAQLSSFAELVFAYIDELSAASAAGHTDELESTGRLRQRNLERLARALITGAAADAVVAAAERAAWEPPRELIAVLLPESQAAHASTLIDAHTLQPVEDLPGVPEGRALLLVPSTGSASARTRLLRALRGTSAVVGPSVPWLEVVRSHQRAVRAVALGEDGLVDADAHLAALVLAADPDTRADLRERVLAPLADQRPSTVEKLTETLRSWVLHQGRRDAVAAELFVHPQTVRYRVQQLRDLYGDRLEDPQFVLEATLALA